MFKTSYRIWILLTEVNRNEVSKVLVNQTGFRLPLPFLKEWDKQQSKVKPKVCQPTDPIFPHSRWSQEPSEQNQRLLDLVIWEHHRAAAREAGGMAGKHAMLSLVQASGSSSPWQGTVWFKLKVLGSHNIDPWGHLYKDTLGYTTLCITPSMYVPSGVALVLTRITQSDEGLLPAHLCSCQQHSVTWVTLQCDSWFLPVAAKTFTPLQASQRGQLCAVSPVQYMGMDFVKKVKAIHSLG